MMRIKIVLILLFLFSVYFSQEKSKVIEKINGKEYYVHQVKKGESLYGISKLYSVESEVILNENPFVKEQGLKAGQSILIPLKAEKLGVARERDTLNYRYHKVLKGQTVYSICKEYTITQEQFYEWNPNNKNDIKENEWLIVGKKSHTKKKEMIVQEIKKEEAEKINNIKVVFEKKKEYKWILLLPFGANKVDEIVVENMINTQENFPIISSMMIDFYKGIEYALDSMRTDSFNVRFLSLDMNEQDSLKIIQMMNTPEYKNADVVVGPVFSSLIKVEQYTSLEKKFHIIPFVSQNKFLFAHPEYSKTTPSLYVDIQALSHYVFDSLRKNSKVILIHSHINGENEYAKELKRYYNELVFQNKGKDTIYTFKNIQDFKRMVKDGEMYTVVFLSNNQVLATDYITQLSIINKTSPLFLCAFYKTITYDNLDLEYLNQMRFTFVYYQNINYKDLFLKFIQKYKGDFQTEPSVFFYEGLQIGFYYLNILKKYGLSGLYKLNEHINDSKDNFIRFHFYHPDENTGFQNNGELVYQIIDRKVIIVK